MASRGISWGELISELEDEFSGLSVDIDRVKHVMQSYRSCEGDWKQYAKFDRYRLDCLYQWFQYLHNLFIECIRVCVCVCVYGVFTGGYQIIS